MCHPTICSSSAALEVRLDVDPADKMDKAENEEERRQVVQPLTRVPLKGSRGAAAV